jgi:cyclase
MMPTRREFVTTCSVVLAGTAVSGLRLFGQQPPATPPATAFTPLRHDTGIFTGRGGTIGWLISPDGVVVVDSQFPDTAKICLDGVRQRAAGRRIDCLINTHHHGDHTAGNGVFREAAGKIVAHARVPELQKMAAARAAQQPAPEPTLPDTTFPERWSLTLGDETVTARHFGPAHTGGDAIIHFERANVVHMGDLMFNRLHPFIDRPAGASIQGWISVLETALREYSDDAMFIFGHAGGEFPVTGGKADLTVQRDYFNALLDYARREVKAGRSRDEVIKAGAVLDGFSDHGPLIERSSGPAYDEVAGDTR